MQIQIRLYDANRVYKPGQRIEGSIEMPVLQAATKLTIELAWQTDGKGTNDSMVVDMVEHDIVDSLLPIDFEFTAPRGPIAFRSKLIRLRWEVIARLKKPALQNSKELVISPIGRPLILSGNLPPG